MWRGSNISTADEWLELYNNSDEIIDLSSWSIFDEVKNEKMVEVVAGLVSPGEYFLISNNTKDHGFSSGESILDIDPDLVDSDISLSNSNFKISLRNSNGEIIDNAGDGGKPFYGEYNGEIASMQRIDFSGSGEYKSSWSASMERKNLDDGVLSFATPKAYGKVLTSFDFGNNRIPLGKEIIFSFSYDSFDPQGEFDRISVELSKGGEVLAQSSADFGQKSFIFAPAKNCPEVKVIIYDVNGLWSSRTFELICYQKSKDIKLSEILPHPKNRDWNSDGKIDKYDEWIELVNLGIDDIDLSGWGIKDKAGKVFKLDGLMIKQGSFLLIYNPKPIAINDDGEELLLVDPEGAVADLVQIPKSGEDIAYAREGENWQWTKTPTPGQANQIVGLEQISDQPDPTVAEAIEDIGDVSEPVVRLAVVTTTKEINLSNLPTQIPKIDAYVLGAQESNSFFKAFLQSRYLLYLASLVMLFSIVFIYEFSRRQR